MPGRVTRAVVDLDALAGNVRVFRQLVPPPTRLMAVVKANGYGHGAAQVARTVLAAGATDLAVGTVEEGAQLRREGIPAPILVLSPVGPAEIALALRLRLTLAVASEEAVQLVASEARAGFFEAPASVHLKIDTGMRRYGCLPEQAPSLVRRISADDHMHLDGIFTHFACADEADERTTADQAERFDAALGTIGREIDLRSVVRHAANSAATLRSRRYDYDMVRLGIALYGADPSPDVPLAPGMRPVMTLLSSIMRVIELSPGDRVSYGGEYAAQRSELAALIPIGYADGYRRGLSNRGWMGLNGARAPVRGRVCMDQTVVGLPELSRASVGDDVVVVGDPNAGAPSWTELADLAETIAYELLTGISLRVPRLYVEGGQVMATSSLLDYDAEVAGKRGNVVPRL
jgi:alanine racemase